MMNFTEAVTKAMSATDTTRSDLARRTGRSYQYISDLLKGKRRWHESIINEVFDALGISIEFVNIERRENDASQLSKAGEGNHRHRNIPKGASRKSSVQHREKQIT
ncbi:helix-turn-helix transcriptional regulator [Paenibacillus sp. DMB5]|uniref:helix-turn-helix domain-containing protein n=1 Tax=Paenibacillus sp. DMB5 TaxID=1780103 RepID=UPI0018E33065|nr:helix-turn-helix transcriptional regulator [Paenibacillus sp. DMB5]